MTNTKQIRNRVAGIHQRVARIALALATVLGLIAVVTRSAQAQTFNVIYNFTGGQDGADPSAGLTMDAAGKLYGTTSNGALGQGTVFRLMPSGSAWVFDRLYAFQGGIDGAYPTSRVLFGRDEIYGTTSGGGAGGSGCCGTVFSLKPQAKRCKVAHCDWKETVLYRFKGGSDGLDPASEIVLDQGNLYGTTVGGGAGNCPDGCGVVFKLTPTIGGWKERVLYQFTGDADGANPAAPVTFDKAGNLNGTTLQGGSLGCNSGFGCGVVFQLTRTQSAWTENAIYAFQDLDDGGSPYAGLILDQSGNLYGATSDSGSSGGGTVFKLTPSVGSASYTVLSSFNGVAGQQGGPHANLAMDSAGNLYGATEFDGAHGYGSVFRLTPLDGGWTYTSLHDFTGGADGAYVVGSVLLDANGNLYGTAVGGGAGHVGVVWEITP
jgi:uncharacterized repeat protein (TIGR03803 family)